MSKKETMTPLSTTEKPIREVKKLTVEDLSYLKQLNDKTREIKGLIGEVEIQKMRLIGDFNTAVSRESEFINQMYTKYNIDTTRDFSIDPVTGEIKIIE